MWFSIQKLTVVEGYQGRWRLNFLAIVVERQLTLRDLHDTKSLYRCSCCPISITLLLILQQRTYCT